MCPVRRRHRHCSQPDRLGSNHWATFRRIQSRKQASNSYCTNVNLKLPKLICSEGQPHPRRQTTDAECSKYPLKIQISKVEKGFATILVIFELLSQLCPEIIVMKNFNRMKKLSFHKMTYAQKRGKNILVKLIHKAMCLIRIASQTTKRRLR